MASLLFVAQSPTQGGVVTVLTHLLAHWPEDGRRLLLVCNKGHGGLGKFRALAERRPLSIIEAPMWDPTPRLYSGAYGKGLRQLAVRLAYRLLSPLQWLWATMYFSGLCRRHSVAAVFSHNGGYPGGMFNRAAVIGAWLAGVERNFMVIHNLARRPRGAALPLAWIHDRLIERAASRLFAVSATCAQSVSAERYFAAPPEVIYNGIPVVEWTPPPGHGGPEFVIGFFGELNPRKGLHILVGALAKLPPRARLRVFGKGSQDYADRLRAAASALGVAERIEFRGFVADAADQMAQVDVVVLPSVDFESFGMVLLEAMQKKKPVVVSDIGGMKEIVQNGVTGYVVAAGSEAALADAIRALMNDHGLAERLGEAGFERLRSHFAVERMVSAYRALAG